MRLSAANPGLEFFVLQPVARVVTPRSPMIITRYDDDTGGEVPF